MRDRSPQGDLIILPRNTEVSRHVQCPQDKHFMCGCSLVGTQSRDQTGFARPRLWGLGEYQHRRAHNRSRDGFP